MPPLVMPDTVRVNVIWSLSGAEYAVNVLHYLVGPATIINQAAADDLSDVIQSAFLISGLDDLFANEVQLARSTVRDLRVASQAEYSSAIAQAGLNGLDILPLSVALVVTLRTALAGRRYRGRTYLSGFAEDSNQGNGTASAAAIIAAEAFIQALETIIVAGNEWSLGVMSIAAGETNAVTSTGVRDNVWDTQRRRSIPGI